VTPARLKRILGSLVDPAQRVRWLATELDGMSVADAALLIDDLVTEVEAADPAAVEALLSVALYCVQLGEGERLQHLREEAAGRHLLGLDRLLRGDPERTGCEEPVAQVPNYGAGRELTLGERRALARRPNRRFMDQLLRDPHPLVVEALLGNPKLTEADVVRLAARRPATLSTLRALAASPKWLCRPRVRIALVLNPGSPACIAMPLLALCTRPELRVIVETTSVSGAVRSAAYEWLERRIPLPGEVDDAQLQ
jgi:hypothetical protein